METTIYKLHDKVISCYAELVVPVPRPRKFYLVPTIIKHNDRYVFGLIESYENLFNENNGVLTYSGGLHIITGEMLQNTSLSMEEVYSDPALTIKESNYYLYKIIFNANENKWIIYCYARPPYNKKVAEKEYLKILLLNGG